MAVNTKCYWHEVKDKCNVGLCLCRCNDLRTETCNIVTITCNDDLPVTGEKKNNLLVTECNLLYNITTEK